MSPRVQGQKLLAAQGVHAVGVAGIIHELNFAGVGGKHLHHGTHFSGDEPEFGHVADKGNGVEPFDGGCGGHLDIKSSTRGN